MAAVLIVSFYYGGDENETKDWYWNVFAWFIGFITYQIAVRFDSIFLGPTLLAIIVSVTLTFIWIKLRKILIN